MDHRKIIRENIDNTLASGYVPELGTHKPGKVRDVHFTSDKLGSPIIMVASDRVSAFDHVLNKQVPCKGKVLTLFTKWAFDNTSDIVKNALLQSPHDNVLVQKRMKKIDFEFVVRGYMWGSMAEDYENGKREFCGHVLPDGLLRYQKLVEPLFTPATKADDGEHDINVSFEFLADKVGKNLGARLMDISLKLYERASKLAKDRGFVFIDTKYEFGLDDKGEVHLIDEANTPDSSRYCSDEELKKFSRIEKEMKSGKFMHVTDLLRKKPELKIKELSKQFVRDILVEKGFSYGGLGKVPELTDDDVVEAAFRYITLYESLTGNKFMHGSGCVRDGLLSSLKQAGMIKNRLAIIMAGSDSDMPHVRRLQDELSKFTIPTVVRICSAHKMPAALESILRKYNDSVQQLVIIAVAGGTDALSGVASFHSVHPVISCPPDAGEFMSCVKNPPGSSNSLILIPANAARHAAQIFSSANQELKKLITTQNEKKIGMLLQADEGAR